MRRILTSFVCLTIACLSVDAFAVANASDREEQNLQRRTRSRSQLNPETIREFVKRFDRDDDGRLSETERKAAQQAIREIRNRRTASSGKRRSSRRPTESQRQPARTGKRIGKRPAPSTTGRPQGRAGMQALLKRFDTNGNGRLEPEELAAAKRARSESGADRKTGRIARAPGSLAALVKRFDENGDGKLDEKERARAKESFQNRTGAGSVGLTSKPRANRVDQSSLISLFDADGDGTLSDTERAQARQALLAKSRPEVDSR